MVGQAVDRFVGGMAIALEYLRVDVISGSLMLVSKRLVGYLTD